MICEGKNFNWFRQFCGYRGNKYLFGTGTQTVNTLFLLELIKERVDGIIVSKVSTDTFEGLPVLDLSEVPDKVSCAVMLSVGAKTSGEIAITLQNSGFENIFFCSDWETANDEIKERVFTDYLEERNIDYTGDVITLNECKFLNPLNHQRCYKQMLMGTFFSGIIVPGIMKDDRYGAIQLFEELEHILTGAEVALDIGANAGVFSAFLATVANRVIAIDAADSIFPYLRDNAGLSGNIEALNLIIGDSDGSQLFYDREDYPKYSSTEIYAGCRVYEKTSLTIDSFVFRKDLKPNLIRLDIGKDSDKALRGARETILRYHPSFLINETDISIEKLKIMLQSDGYYIRSVCGWIIAEAKETGKEEIIV